MDLKEKLKTLPKSPGVYLMKDSSGSILYVGKSKNLKSRVSSYFHSSKAHSPKVVKLTKHLKDFDFILTDTEFEAFLLECKLIKDLKPIYNRMMKNPLSYTYIEISRDYLNIGLCSEKKDTASNYYFGPYGSKSTVENALEGIKETCKIKCSGSFKSTSPCLNYSLGKCMGICFDASAKLKYPAVIKEISELLLGDNKNIINKMELNMNSAAQNLEFDTAIKYRDYITAVNSLINREKILEFVKENENIAVVEFLDESNIKFFLISGISIIYKEKFSLDDCKLKPLAAYLSNTVIKLLKSKPYDASTEIGKNEIDQTQIIYSYLNSKQKSCNYFSIPEACIENNDEINLQISIDNIIKR
ncbi:GIY-YIG nuclease family protein [Clostridium sp. YIM B02515]|uniref:GIY-YIG nuclease family protein n=1 Tax=Clostridium rhizosphaerae TaxID=2803861 RepID=A0ABS1TCA5_9CLOT|nr:GIY-YIG nuclease family protein [Clostridium rhizosphaerae]MBL4935618.1 GIY-YIG nuclease family protein [Clostridium rhizosphaerae]